MIQLASSPVQMLRLVFPLVHVEVNQAFSLDKLNEEVFDFSGVNIGHKVSIDRLKEKNKKSSDFLVQLEISIPKDSSEGKQMPYIVRIAAAGVFSVHAEYPNDKKESLAFVNGASMIYSAMREQVLQITTRSPYGMMMLPTIQFLLPSSPAADVTTD